MNPEVERHHGGEGEDVREFRLEGLGLLLFSAVMLAALSGAFYLGRWYESRHRGPSTTAAAATLPGADAETRTKVVSAEEGLTAFDTVGSGAVAEPRREARPGERAERGPGGGAVPAPSTSPSAPAPASAVTGPFTVQVAAVRERRSAEQLYGELKDRGFEARIDAVREGGDTVYKVRVGGFPTKESASPVADRLKSAGYASWVTRAE